MNEIKRPEGCTDEHLCYLDDLRESGACNMFGASSFLVDEFRISKKLAIEIFGYWMITFDPNK